MIDPPAAILFDLDDTILDTTLSATRAWRETARAFEHEIGRPADEFDPILDRVRAWYWADPQRNQAGRLDVQRARIDVTRHGLAELGIDDAHLAQRFSDHYTEHRVEAMQFFEGALDTLKHFHDAGVPLALLTNGDARGQREKVDRFELDRFFRVVWIEGERGYGKPDPRVFREALRVCGVGPEQAWCVGDHLAWEVDAPQKLGLAGIWCDWRGGGLPADSDVRPDRIVRWIAELRP
jgi:putative hydrolase of the HAD superfamily